MENISKYLNKKLNEEIVPETPQQFNPISASAKALWSGIAIVAGAKLAYELIKPVYDKWKWKHDGCHNIIDPTKKEMCKNYIKKGIVDDLIRQRGKCKDDECVGKIDEEIEKYS